MEFNYFSKKIKNIVTRHKYKKFNLENFPRFNLSKKFVMVEFNAFNESHVCQSLLANFLAKKYHLNIIGYFNYSILSAPLKSTFIQKIKWKIGEYLNYKNRSIYKSFGCKKVIRPDIKRKNKAKVEKLTKNIFKKLKNKNDILKIKIDKILIGDLLYDTFLKSNQIASINISEDKFFYTLKDFIHLYFYWRDFFKENKIHSIIGVHSVYSYGLPLRIAISQNIKAYTINSREISKITVKNKFMNTNFLDYPTTFRKLSESIKKKGLLESKKILESRLSGKAGISSHLISKISSFHSQKQKSLIRKSEKIKVLICTRNIFDATHVFGNLLFTDNLDWLNFLGKLSEKTNYDWYLKTHRNFDGKFKLYQPNSNKIIFKIFSKYKKIKILPNDYSHNQIINEKIDFILTQHGSVGFEYPYVGIPVINASYNNPQVAYKFNFHPKTKKAYEKILKDLINLKSKIKIDKNEILEFYFMRHLYQDRKWLFDDPIDLIKKIGGWDNMMSENFYKYAICKLNQKKISNINKTFENFLSSSYQSVTIKDSSKI